MTFKRRRKKKIFSPCSSREGEKKKFCCSVIFRRELRKKIFLPDLEENEKEKIECEGENDNLDDGNSERRPPKLFAFFSMIFQKRGNIFSLFLISTERRKTQWKSSCFLFSSKKMRNKKKNFFFSLKNTENISFYFSLKIPNFSLMKIGNQKKIKKICFSSFSLLEIFVFFFPPSLRWKNTK